MEAGRRVGVKPLPILSFQRLVSNQYKQWSASLVMQYFSQEWHHSSENQCRLWWLPPHILQTCTMNLCCDVINERRHRHGNLNVVKNWIGFIEHHNSGLHASAWRHVICYWALASWKTILDISRKQSKGLEGVCLSNEAPPILFYRTSVEAAWLLKPLNDACCSSGRRTKSHV